jgi:hypothetical protein
VGVLREPVDNGEDHQFPTNTREAFHEIHDDVGPD